MKVLELTPYYFPEQIASTHISDDLEEAFVTAGFEVEIHTPTPTRSVTDERRKQYRKLWRDKKYDGKIQIYRFPMFRERKNSALRAFRYVLVNIIQYWKSIHTKDIDVIFGASTPPTQGLLCSLVKKRLKVPFVYNLQDIFPDSMVNAGMTRKGSLLWKIGRKMEDCTYRNADKIIVISEDFKKNIMAKDVPENKIEVIYNWVDTDKVKPVAREDNRLFDELGLDRSLFYVTYAGNLGPAQNVGLVLDAAEKLKVNPAINFVIFGDGVEKEKLAGRIEGMDNAHLFPLQPADRVSEVYSLGDISLVIAKKGVGEAAMPSKTWSIMSAGAPVLASFDTGTELEKILKEFNCGKLVEAENVGELAECILWLYENSVQCAVMGRNARSFATSHLSKATCVGKYVAIIGDCSKQKPASY